MQQLTEDITRFRTHQGCLLRLGLQVVSVLAVAILILAEGENHTLRLSRVPLSIGLKAVRTCGGKGVCHDVVEDSS